MPRRRRGKGKKKLRLDRKRARYESHLSQLEQRLSRVGSLDPLTPSPSLVPAPDFDPFGNPVVSTSLTLLPAEVIALITNFITDVSTLFALMSTSSAIRRFVFHDPEIGSYCSIHLDFELSYLVGHALDPRVRNVEETENEGEDDLSTSDVSPYDQFPSFLPYVRGLIIDRSLHPERWLDYVSSSMPNLSRLRFINTRTRDLLLPSSPYDDFMRYRHFTLPPKFDAPILSPDYGKSSFTETHEIVLPHEDYFGLLRDRLSRRLREKIIVLEMGELTVEYSRSYHLGMAAVGQAQFDYELFGEIFPNLREVRTPWESFEVLAEEGEEEAEERTVFSGPEGSYWMSATRMNESHGLDQFDDSHVRLIEYRDRISSNRLAAYLEPYPNTEELQIVVNLVSPFQLQTPLFHLTKLALRVTRSYNVAYSPEQLIRNFLENYPSLRSVSSVEGALHLGVLCLVLEGVDNILEKLSGTLIVPHTLSGIQVVDVLAKTFSNLSHLNVSLFFRPLCVAEAWENDNTPVVLRSNTLEVDCTEPGALPLLRRLVLRRLTRLAPGHVIPGQRPDDYGIVSFLSLEELIPFFARCPDLDLYESPIFFAQSMSLIDVDVSETPNLLSSLALTQQEERPLVLQWDVFVHVMNLLPRLETLDCDYLRLSTYSSRTSSPLNELSLLTTLRLQHVGISPAALAHLLNSSPSVQDVFVSMESPFTGSVLFSHLLKQFSVRRLRFEFLQETPQPVDLVPLLKYFPSLRQIHLRNALFRPNFHHRLSSKKKKLRRISLRRIVLESTPLGLLGHNALVRVFRHSLACLRTSGWDDLEIEGTLHEPLVPSAIMSRVTIEGGFGFTYPVEKNREIRNQQIRERSHAEIACLVELRKNLLLAYPNVRAVQLKWKHCDPIVFCLHPNEALQESGFSKRWEVKK